MKSKKLQKGCKACGASGPFYVYKDGRRHARCIPCHRAAGKLWLATAPDAFFVRQAELQAEWRKRNPDRVAAYNAATCERRKLERQAQ